jgi:hypothetical protein
MQSRAKYFLALALTFAIATGGCGDSGSDTDPLAGMQSAFTHKMMQATGENRFAALGYECQECTWEQIAAIVPPPGWTKGPTQVLIPTGEMRSRPSFEGVPDAVDFVPEIPGAEYRLIVKNVDARIIEIGAMGVVVEAQVMRDTLLRFPPTALVHELTDPDGNVFVLFVHGIDPNDPYRVNYLDPDSLSYFTPPEGWTYGNRVLTEELLLDADGSTTVIAIRGENDSTWEKR